MKLNTESTHEADTAEQQCYHQQYVAGLEVSVYLVVHLPLQLDDLVLHARVEFLQVLGRASFDLQLLQPALGEPASVRTLDDDGGGARPSELLPLQPAAHALLDDHGLVVHEELQETGRHSGTFQLKLETLCLQFTRPFSRQPESAGRDRRL